MDTYAFIYFYDGTQWTRTTLGSVDYLNSVYFLSPLTGWAAGCKLNGVSENNGVILKFDPNGGWYIY